MTAFSIGWTHAGSSSAGKAESGSEADWVGIPRAVDDFYDEVASAQLATKLARLARSRTRGAAARRSSNDLTELAADTSDGRLSTPC
jgi:hypothetical protein